jgi:hypothetical protein
MKTKRITLIVVLLFSTLIFAGCAHYFHHGERHCGPPCEMAEGQKPCQQQKNCEKMMENKPCEKMMENKPCCDKMKAAEAPAK